MEMGHTTSTIRILSVLLSALLVTTAFSTVVAAEELALDGSDPGDTTDPDSHTDPLDRVHPASFDPPSHPATDGAVLANLTLDVDTSVDDDVPAQDPVYDRITLEKDAELGVDEAADVQAVWVGGQKLDQSVPWENDDCTVDPDASNVLLWGGFVASDDTYSICETSEQIHITLDEPVTIQQAAVTLALNPLTETGTYDLNVTLLETAHGLDHVLGVPYQDLLTETGEEACDPMPAQVRDVVDQLPHGCSFAVVTAQQVPFEVTPAAPDHLHFETQPPATVGVNATWDPFSVRVEDEFHNLAFDDDATQVTLASNASATDTLRGTTASTVSEGIATFDNVSYLTAETLRVNATSPGLDDATSDPVEVTPGALAGFDLDCPSTVDANATFTCTVPVDSGVDPFGNPVAVENVSWSGELDDGTGLEPVASSSDADEFNATFRAPKDTALGPVTVRADGTRNDTTVTETADVTVEPADLASFTLDCPDQVEVDSPFTCSVPADSGVDRFGNQITLASVDWSATDATGAEVTLVSTNASGTTFDATFRAPSDDDVGPVTVAATGADADGAEATESADVGLEAGGLASFTLNCETSTVVNTTFTCTVPADSGEDTFGNDVNVTSVAWNATASDGSSVAVDGTSSNETTFTANFTAPTDVDDGPVTVEANGMGEDGAEATETADVGLEADALAAFDLSCDDSAVVNTTFSCSMPADSGRDRYGNDVTVASVNWSAEDDNKTTISADETSFDGSTFHANFTAPDSVDLGPVTVQATGEDAEANTAAETITVDLFAPAAQLVFVEAPQNMTAGEPVGLTIQRQDADGHPVTEEPEVDVDLSTTSADGDFLNATGATVSTVTIPEGSANVTVSYNDTDAGDQTLTADNASLDPAQHTIEVQPAELTEIGIACDPIEVPAGETTDCEATPLDAFGNERDDEPTWTAHDGGWFDPSTGQTTTYHPPTDVDTYNVSASADGVTSNTVTVEVVPGDLHRFVFLDNPVGERVNVSADVAEATVRVRAFDAYENPVPDQTVHWEIDAGENGSIATDPSTTDEDGITSVKLTTSNQTGADFEYRVQAIDDPVDPIVTRRSGLWVVVPGEAHAVLLDGAPTDLSAGETIDLDVAVVDAHGNVLDAGDNDLDGDRDATFAGPSAAPDGTEPICAGDPVGTTTSLSVDSGTNATACTLYAAEDVTLTLDVSGVPNEGSLDLSVDPADADHLAWTSTPGDRIEVGDCSGFALEVQDAWDNAQPTGEVTVDLSGTGGGAFHTDTECGNATSQVTLADGQADASVHFNSTVAENLTLNASSTGLDPALHDLAVQPGPATHFEVDCVDPADCSLTAGGTLDVDLTAEDRFDNVVDFGDHAYEGDKTLVFSGPAPSPGGDAPTCEGEEIGQPVTVAFADGTATATCALYGAEDATLTVADGPVTGSVDVVVLPAELDKYAVDPPRGDNQDALQNGTYTVTATALDAFENPLPGQDVHWFLMRGSTNEDPSSGSLDAGITQTDASGEATVDLTVSDDPGDFFRVTAADDSDLVQAETTETTARFVVRLSVHDGESIDAVVDQDAASGQIVLVEAGTYDETVTVDKTVILRGAQAGTDARTRTGADESVVGTASGGFVLTADNVTLDGFTVRGVTDCLQGGISTSPTASGYTINNTIVRDNELGIKLRADGDTPTVVRHNRLEDNDRAWYDGTCDEVAKAVSTGFDSGDVLHNATIDANRFVGHTEGGNSYAIQLVAGQGGHGNVTVSDNDLTGDSSIVLADLDGGAIDDNRIVMDDDDSSTAVFVAGNVSDVTISDNLVNGTERGIWFAPDFFGVPTKSSGVDILGNTITGNPTAGIQVADGRYTGDLDIHQNSIADNGFGVNNTDADLVVDARDNWWGASDGPSGGVEDPVTGVLADGLGDAVSEDPDDPGVSNVRFDPWLTSEP